MRLLRQSRADHAVAGDEARKAFVAPAVGARRAHRQHEITNFRGRIPDANIGALRQLKTEIPEHAAGILHRLGAIGRGFVPDRRQSNHRPRITGTKGAHDHVVEHRSVLDAQHVLTRTPPTPDIGTPRPPPFTYTTPTAPPPP